MTRSRGHRREQKYTETRKRESPIQFPNRIRAVCTAERRAQRCHDPTVTVELSMIDRSFRGAVVSRRVFVDELSADGCYRMVDVSIYRFKSRDFIFKSEIAARRATTNEPIYNATLNDHDSGFTITWRGKMASPSARHRITYAMRMWHHIHAAARPSPRPGALPVADCRSRLARPTRPWTRRPRRRG